MLHFLCFSCRRSVYRTKEDPVVNRPVRCSDCEPEYARQKKELRDLEARLLANDFYEKTGTR